MPGAAVGTFNRKARHARLGLAINAALGVASLGLTGGFDAAAAVAALEGLVLAKGELLALYSTNPAVIATLPK